MGKILKGETHLVIPNDTLVLIVGSQNSGKTTFTQKHFKDKNIICTDDIFNEIVYKKSTVLDTLETIENRTIEEFGEIIIKSAKEKGITVVDAVPILFDNRMETLRELKELYNNIILIVLDIKFTTLKGRPKKPIDRKKRKFGITETCDEELLLNSILISEQIQNKKIGYNVDTAYVLSEEDVEKCIVTFE